MILSSLQSLFTAVGVVFWSNKASVAVAERSVLVEDAINWPTLDAGEMRYNTQMGKGRTAEVPSHCAR